MNENITAVVLCDKTKTLGRIKPFYCTLFHFELLHYIRFIAEPFNNTPGHIVRPAAFAVKKKATLYPIRIVRLQFLDFFEPSIGLHNNIVIL